jgi:outer membrane protein TolC
LLGESPLIDLIDAQEQKLAADTQSKTVYYTFLIDLLQLEQALGYYPFYHTSIPEVEVIQNLEQLLLTK